MTEEFAFDDVESSPVSFDSHVALIDRKAENLWGGFPSTEFSKREARAIARQERARMRKALKDLAEKENIPKWQQAIAQ